MFPRRAAVLKNMASMLESIVQPLRRGARQKPMLHNRYETIRIIAVTTALIIPAPLLAGAYGESSVRDGKVENLATSQATVPCPRLNRSIPASLASEMDCGTARATARVAGERVRNNPLASFFGRHKRGSGLAASVGDGPNTTSQSNDTPVVSAGPIPTNSSSSSGPVAKWDRLGELGVTPDNFASQPDSFKDEFSSFAEENGLGGDWSGFNPD